MGNSWNSGLRGIERNYVAPLSRMGKAVAPFIDNIGNAGGAIGGFGHVVRGGIDHRGAYAGHQRYRSNTANTDANYSEIELRRSEQARDAARKDFMRGVGPQSQHYAAQGTTATAPSIDSPTPNPQTTTYTLPAANGELAHPYGVEQPKIAANQVHGIQTMLSALGYDLGPTGVDNAYGPKTEAALKQLAQRAGVNFDELDYTQPGNPAVNKLMSYANGQTQQAQQAQQQAQPEAAPSQTEPAAAPPPPPQTQPLAQQVEAVELTPLEKYGKHIAMAFNPENATNRGKVQFYTNRANEQFMAMTGGTGVLNVPEGGMQFTILDFSAVEKMGAENPGELIKMGPDRYTISIPPGSYNVNTFTHRVTDGIAQNRAQSAIAQASYVQHQPQQQVAALHQPAQPQPHYAPAPRHDDVELGNLAAPSTFARDYNMDQGQHR